MCCLFLTIVQCRGNSNWIFPLQQYILPFSDSVILLQTSQAECIDNISANIQDKKSENVSLDWFYVVLYIFRRIWHKRNRFIFPAYRWQMWNSISMLISRIQWDFLVYCMQFKRSKHTNTSYHIVSLIVTSWKQLFPGKS